MTDAPGTGNARVGVVLAVAVTVAVAAALVASPALRDRIGLSTYRAPVATAVGGPRPSVVVAGPGATLRRVDAATGDVVASVPTPGETVRALAAVPAGDATRIATGDADGTVRIRDLDDPGRPSVLGRHDGPVTALTPTVQLGGMPVLVSGGTDGTLRTWDPTGRVPVSDAPDSAIRPDGAPVRAGRVRALVSVTRPEESGPVTELYVGTADGYVAVTASGASLVEGGTTSSSGGVTAVAAVRPRPGSVPAGAFPPLDPLIAAGYGDGSIRVLDALAGNEQTDRSTRPDPVHGAVTALIALPAGTGGDPGTRGDTVVAGYRDGTVRRYGSALGGGPFTSTVLPAAARDGYALAAVTPAGRPVVVAALADGSIVRWSPGD